MEASGKTPGLAQFPPGNAPAISQASKENWKSTLSAKFKTPDHKMPSELDRHLSYCVNSDPRLDISRLVCQCALHKEVDALRDILANEPIGRLTIAGIDRAGWKTLLEAMPEVLATNSLELSNMDMSTAACGQLFELMGRMPGLTSLAISSTKVLAAIPSELPECPRLRNSISLSVREGENLHLLVIRIAEHTELHALLFQQLGISVEQQKELAAGLKKQDKIESLCWSKMQVSSKACSMLIGHSHFLTEFSLQKCKLTNDFFHTDDADELHEIAEISEVNDVDDPQEISHTDEIDEGNEEGSFEGEVEDAPADSFDFFSNVNFSFLEELMSIKGLYSLDFSDTCVNDPTLIGMLSKLGTHKSLERLNLQGTGASGPAFEALASALKTNQSLTHLSIHWNAASMPLLVEAMRENKWLRQLRVSGTSGDDAKKNLEELDEFIVRNQRLHMESNVAYVRGAMSVLLNSNPTIRMPLDVAGRTSQIAYEQDQASAMNLALINRQALALAKATQQAWLHDQGKGDGDKK
jgi:hypothetical protein